MIFSLTTTVGFGGYTGHYRKSYEIKCNSLAIKLTVLLIWKRTIFRRWLKTDTKQKIELFLY